jgi:HTH-type transcriptional regulator/antitoxin HipB
MKPPMIYSPVQLANTMRLVRQKNNWTQSDLAKRIGIKQATISNFENNPDNTTLTTFFRILQSLGMTMALYEKDDTASGSDNNNQQGLDW